MRTGGGRPSGGQTLENFREDPGLEYGSGVKKASMIPYLNKGVRTRSIGTGGGGGGGGGNNVSQLLRADNPCPKKSACCDRRYLTKENPSYRI